MSQYIFTIFYVAGILQSLILCLALLKKKTLASSSNRVLLLLLVSLLFVLIQYTFVVNQIPHGIRLLRTMASVSWFAIGPLFYLFIKTSTDASFKFKTHHVLYFSFAIYNGLHYIFPLIQLNLGFYLLFQNPVIYAYVWLGAYLAHGIVFSILTINLLRIKETVRTKGMLTYFYAFLSLLFISLVYLIFDTNGLVYFTSLERILVIVFSFFSLLLTFKSLRNSTLFATGTQLNKYSNSPLSGQELDKLHGHLSRIMLEKKPHLDRKLNLKVLAEISGIKENQLSQIFSLSLQSSFYDFIREYRLNEVENLLKNPRFSHMKIASLAADCGFNSNAAFYKAFKEKHGMTPTKYLEHISAESS